MSGAELIDDEVLQLAGRYFFRGLHPLIAIGTASDRYKGWIGQIYSEDLYRDRIVSRTNRVGKESFREEVLPVESVREYFQHFKVLEIDYTFYAPLIENTAPTSTANTLRQYAIRMGPEDRVFLKAPQMFFARKLKRGNDYAPNKNYLASEAFTRQFYEPALDLLGRNLKGIIFEQEYQRRSERIPPVELAAQLDRFFSSIPHDNRYHVELRTEEYYCKPVIDVLLKHGAGQVLSHWTWLPSLQRQFSRAGKRFITAGGQSIIRLMTPIGIRYEDAYARAFPFNRLIEQMIQPGMISQTAQLMWEALRDDVEINIIINNRAGGNAPGLAQRIVRQFVEMAGEGRPIL
ncbi:MAG TPA: DUF72 domain-containing protein [Syntrophobacteraceae bacterium]|nr:DUF72 domain-containing protein [Syntrophobacteraceae bacterium]